MISAEGIGSFECGTLAGLAAARLVLPGRTCRTPRLWTAHCPIFLGLSARLFPPSYISAVNE